MRKTLRRARRVLALLLLPGAVAATTTLPQSDITWLRRATFGIDTITLQRYQQLGRHAYLDDALSNRSDALPPPIKQLMDGYTALHTPAAQLLVDYRQQMQLIKSLPDGEAKSAAKKVRQKSSRVLLQQAQQAQLLHAIYGANPLREQMVWFWLNHFSIYGGKGPVKLLAADYQDNVIRPHALGKFRDLVMATLQSSAMLAFLDNAQNVKGRTNENYARELMELHTLGVSGGYTQQDVQALTLILTGAGLTPVRQLERESHRGNPAGPIRSGLIQHGLFTFNPARHDASDKLFLGHTIKSGGFDEVEQAVELIVKQPACARFISQKLATYFVADQPPTVLVDAMAHTFERTDGDIAAVLRTLFTSAAVTTRPGTKFKDPMQFLVSAMRLRLDGTLITNAAPLAKTLAQMGEPIDGRITPDGWPLDGASWSASGQMARRFDVARVVGSGFARLFTVDESNTPDNGARSKPPMRAPSLNNALYQQTLAPWLTPATRSALSQAKSPREWNTFLLASPEFNSR